MKISGLISEDECRTQASLLGGIGDLVAEYTTEHIAGCSIENKNIYWNGDYTYDGKKDWAIPVCKCKVGNHKLFMLGNGGELCAW